MKETKGLYQLEVNVKETKGLYQLQFVIALKNLHSPLKIDLSDKKEDPIKCAEIEF